MAQLDTTEQQTQELSPSLLSDILAILEHEITKPEAALKMLEQLRQENAVSEEQHQTWQQNILGYFTSIRQLINKTKAFTKDDLLATTVDLKATLTTINQQRGREVYRWNSNPAPSIISDPDTITLLFEQFTSYVMRHHGGLSSEPTITVDFLVNNQTTHTTTHTMMLEVHAGNQSDSDTTITTAKDRLTSALFDRALTLLAGNFSRVATHPRAIYQISLPSNQQEIEEQPSEQRFT